MWVLDNSIGQATIILNLTCADLSLLYQMWFCSTYMGKSQNAWDSSISQGLVLAEGLREFWVPFIGKTFTQSNVSFMLFVWIIIWRYCQMATYCLFSWQKRLIILELWKTSLTITCLKSTSRVPFRDSCPITIFIAFVWLHISHILEIINVWILLYILCYYCYLHQSFTTTYHQNLRHLSTCVHTHSVNDWWR